SAQHLHAVRIACSRLREDVPGLDRRELGLEREVAGELLRRIGLRRVQDRVPELLALGLLEAERGRAALHPLAEGAVDRSFGVVVDDDAGRTGLGRVGGLLPERALTAL